MSVEYVSTMSLEYCVSYVPERFRQRMLADDLTFVDKHLKTGSVLSDLFEHGDSFVKYLAEICQWLDLPLK